MAAIGASYPELTRTETDVVDAVRAGDEQAFGELYERYRRRIFSYVLGMVGDYSRAEDVTQDVFISALRRLRASDCPISFKPWLYEIAKNACIDEHRRLRRAQEVPIEQQERDEHLVSPAPSPDACLEHRQQLAALNGAFRGLSDRQHTVIVLRELEGLSYTQIAAQTGMSLPMVESTLSRARRRLGEEYDDIASGRRCQQVHAVIGEGGPSAVNGLGVRERRRFYRHLAHCQPCARYAWAAGIASPEPRVPRVVKKIAGLLPFPFMRWPWGSHGGARLLHGARKAASLAHPSVSAGVSPAAATVAAAVVIAGGGAALELSSPGHPPRPRPPAVVAPARAAAVMPLPAPPHRLSIPRGLTPPVAVTTKQRKQVARSRSGPPAPGGETATAGTGSGSSRSGGNDSAGGDHPVPPAGTPGGTPSVPKVVHSVIPSLPPLPSVPTAKRLIHKVTKPVDKLLKKTGPLLPPLPHTAPLLDRAQRLLDISPRR